MRDEIESRIAQLRAALAAEEQKLQKLVETIPQELHSLTREVYERLKAFFD